MSEFTNKTKRTIAVKATLEASFVLDVLVGKEVSQCNQKDIATGVTQDGLPIGIPIIFGIVVE